VICDIKVFDKLKVELISSENKAEITGMESGGIYC
jgi:hypothetical protein